MNITIDDLMKKLMELTKPSLFLNDSKNSLEGTPLAILNKLKNIEQELKFHPEGNVWNHTMLVIDNAATVKELANDKEAFMLAALFHDIGKLTTTKRNKADRITSYDHDNEGARICKEILIECGYDIGKSEKVCNLVKYHMHHIYILKELPFGNIEEMVKSIDLNDLVLIFFCDKRGRGGQIDTGKLYFEIKKIIEQIKNKAIIDEDVYLKMVNLMDVVKKVIK